MNRATFQCANATSHQIFCKQKKNKWVKRRDEPGDPCRGRGGGGDGGAEPPSGGTGSSGPAWRGGGGGKGTEGRKGKLQGRRRRWRTSCRTLPQTWWPPPRPPPRSAAADPFVAANRATRPLRRRTPSGPPGSGRCAPPHAVIHGGMARPRCPCPGTGWRRRRWSGDGEGELLGWLVLSLGATGWFQCGLAWALWDHDTVLWTLRCCGFGVVFHRCRCLLFGLFGCCNGMSTQGH